MNRSAKKVAAAALVLATVFALAGATLAADHGRVLELSGSGSALEGTARGDVSRVVVVRVDGTELELAVADGRFGYEAAATGAEAESVRAYAGDRLLSVARVEPGAATQARDTAAAAVLASRSGMRLAPVDPATLRPLTRGFDLGRPSSVPVAAAPDGRTFAAALGGRAVVRLVRFKPFEHLADVRVADDAGGFRFVTQLGWLGPDRLLAVVERLSRPYRRHIRERSLVVVDPEERRVVARRPLPKLAGGQTTTAGGRLVLLFARSSQRDDRVTIAVTDGTFVRTKQIVVGRRGSARVQTAFAVAPSGDRGFLFTDGWDGRTHKVISVDLDTLRAQRHSLQLPSGRIAPAGVSMLQAAAVNDAHVAVTGVIASTVKGRGAAGGVWLVDTDRWTAQPLDPRAVYVRAHEGRVLTFGVGARSGGGISIFSASGRRLHHLFGTTRLHLLEFAGPYGHLFRIRRDRSRYAFDVRTGESLGTFPGLKEEVLRVVSGVASPARRMRARAADPFATISNRGTRIRLAPESRRGMRKSVRAYLLATEDGYAFYRLEGWQRGVACWGNGRAVSPGVLGSFGCMSSFPSRSKPLLESAAIEQSRAGFRVMRVTGFAADAIRTVELIAEDGTVTSETVSRNVFSFPSPPGGLVRLLARTADGTVVVRRSYGPRPQPTVTPPKVKRIGGYSLRVLVPPDWDGRVYRQLPPPALIGPVLQAANFRLPPRATTASSQDHSGLPMARSMAADGILISLRELPNTCCSFPVVTRLPVRLRRSDFTRYQAPSQDRSLALEHVRVRGRFFELFVYFGRLDVPQADLDAANRVLTTLVVGPRPPLMIDRKPLQHGAAPGVTVDVFRDNVIIFSLSSLTSPLARKLRATPGVSLQCVKVRFNGHSWSADGTGAGPRFGQEMYVSLPTSSIAPFRVAKPPYDGCSLGTTRGWTWNDARGTHREVEVGFTAIGRRYYDEQAAARDLGLFVRQRNVRRLRRGGAAPFDVLARTYPGRIVRLASPTATPRAGQIGYWPGGAGTYTFSTSSVGGRRLFVEVRAGKVVRHNLAQLASVH